MWPCARYGSCESTVGADTNPKRQAPEVVPNQVSVPILTSTNRLRVSALTHPAIANETGYGQPVFIGRIYSLGELRGSSQIPQLRMLPPVHLGKTSGLVHPVEPLDSCVPLQISIGSVPLSLFIREEALLEPATRRYREFTHNSENGFPIVLKKTGKRTQEGGEFSYLLDDARLILRSQGAEFHGVRHEYALDSLLRILLTMVLLPQRGFLLHGATVVRDGRAYIFFGRSGAGKSTVASLVSRKGTVLTDEISLLRYSDGCWQAHGTPFWGEFRAAGQNRLVPVAGLYLLKQASRGTPGNAGRKTGITRAAALRFIFRKRKTGA